MIERRWKHILRLSVKYSAENIHAMSLKKKGKKYVGRKIDIIATTIKKYDEKKRKRAVTR